MKNIIKKKAFTLIEILAVIIVLGIIGMITVPLVNSIVRNSKYKALNQTIDSLEKAAYNYSNRNDLEYSSQTNILEIQTLKEAGVIKDEMIINPVTNEELQGCIFYRWDSNFKQYTFFYDEDCELRDIEIVITNHTGVFNENDWANKDFYAKVSTNNTGNSFSYCVSNKECSPNIPVNKSEQPVEVVIESEHTYVCAYGSYNSQSSEIVCKTFKLDKTKPTPGSIQIVGTEGNNEWYTSDVELKVIDGIDKLSGHDSTVASISSVTTNSITDVIITTTDKAGNAISSKKTVKVDKTIPTVTIAKSVVNNQNKLTATVVPTTTVSNYTYEWYKDGVKINNETASILTTTTAGTYKVKVTTGAGISAESNEITIHSYNVTYNLNGGTGTIANQTKIEDLTLTLSSVVPSRTGYTFMGWGLIASSHDVSYASGASYTKNEALQLHAIWKKVITITFAANGASLSKTSDSCEMYNADTSCNVTAPTITRTGFTIVGFNTNANAQTKQIANGATFAVNSNATYNAITSKVVTLTFYRNNAASITLNGKTATTAASATDTCTIWNTATTCNITSGTISAPTNTPTVLGWGTSANANASAWNVSTAKSFSSDASYYAQTTKGEKTITISYNANGGTGATDSTPCKIVATFNNIAQETSCDVTLASNKFNRTNYSFQGWGTSTSSVSYNAGTTKSFSANTTLYAIWTSNINYCSNTTQSDSWWGSCSATCGSGTQQGTRYFYSSIDSSVSCGSESISRSCSNYSGCATGTPVYACTGDYKVVDGTDTCVKDATPVYTCKDNSYSLSGNQCVKGVAAETKCKDGYTYVNGTCQTTTTANSTSICPSGSYESSTGYCVDNSKRSVSSFTCSVGTACLAWPEYSSHDHCVINHGYGECSEGDLDSDGMCYKRETKIVNNQTLANWKNNGWEVGSAVDASNSIIWKIISTGYPNCNSKTSTTGAPVELYLGTGPLGDKQFKKGLCLEYDEKNITRNYKCSGGFELINNSCKIKPNTCSGTLKGSTCYTCTSGSFNSTTNNCVVTNESKLYYQCGTSISSSPVCSGESKGADIDYYLCDGSKTSSSKCSYTSTTIDYYDCGGKHSATPTCY